MLAWANDKCIDWFDGPLSSSVWATIIVAWTTQLNDVNPNFVSDGKFAIFKPRKYIDRSYFFSVSLALSLSVLSFFKVSHCLCNFNIMEYPAKELMAINSLFYNKVSLTLSHQSDNEKLFCHRFFVAFALFFTTRDNIIFFTIKNCWLRSSSAIIKKILLDSSMVCIFNRMKYNYYRWRCSLLTICA